MERMNCIVMEDNILEFLDEIEKQMTQGVICCKCKKPCDPNTSTKCRVAMKNLLTDIGMFRKAYSEVNADEVVEADSVESVQEKVQIND